MAPYVQPSVGDMLGELGHEDAPANIAASLGHDVAIDVSSALVAQIAEGTALALRSVVAVPAQQLAASLAGSLLVQAGRPRSSARRAAKAERHGLCPLPVVERHPWDAEFGDKGGTSCRPCGAQKA
eukprot:10187559-Alexandrium_andersonii.AAC.1